VIIAGVALAFDCRWISGAAMTEEFDPYHKWLGIPRWEQPPNHYRLLGLTSFESDPDAIESAADQRMMHVRTFQSGVHSAESQRLLNELAAAKLCLLNAERKYAYDTELMAKQRSPLAPQQAKWPTVVPKAVDPVPIELAPPAKRRRPKINLPEVFPTPSDAHKTLLFAAGIGGVLVIGFVFYKTRDPSPRRVTPGQSAAARQLVRDDADKAREILEARDARKGRASAPEAGASGPTTTTADDFFSDDSMPASTKPAADDAADFFVDDAPPHAATRDANSDRKAVDEFFDGDDQAAKDDFFSDGKKKPNEKLADDFFDDNN
jgi:hypothetical protein